MKSDHQSKLGKFSSTLHRRGLSDVVSSLLLIGITLVAGSLIGEFLLGILTTSDEGSSILIQGVQVLQPSQSGYVYLTFQLVNDGSQAVTVDHVALSAGGPSLTPLSGSFTEGNEEVTLSSGQSSTFTGTWASSVNLVGEESAVLV